MIANVCSCPRRCASRGAMRKAHGTPEEFAEALSDAWDFFTSDEDDDVRTALARYRQEYEAAPEHGHVHSCPECYEHVPCREKCDVEPDLMLDDGTPRGSFVTCDACERVAKS